MATAPSAPLLSPSQLDQLAEIGERRTARVGDVLFQVGDRATRSSRSSRARSRSSTRPGTSSSATASSGFLGELNLLSGQTVFLTAVVTKPLEYIAVEREDLRPLLFDDGSLSDLLLSTFIARREALQRVHGIGIEIVGPRSSAPTMRMVDFARRNHLPFTWRDPAHDEAAAALVAGLDDASLPVVRLPGGPELRGPSTGRGLAPARHRPRARAARGGRPARRRRRPGRPRRRGVRRLGGARHARRSRATRSAARRARRAGSRTTSASRPGSPAPS